MGLATLYPSYGFHAAFFCTVSQNSASFSASAAMILFLIGVFYFERVERRFADII